MFGKEGKKEKKKEKKNGHCHITIGHKECVQANGSVRKTQGRKILTIKGLTLRPFK